MSSARSSAHGEGRAACAMLGLPRDQGLICRYERGEASPRRERMLRILAIIAGTEVQP